MRTRQRTRARRPAIVGVASVVDIEPPPHTSGVVAAICWPPKRRSARARKALTLSYDTTGYPTPARQRVKRRANQWPSGGAIDEKTFRAAG